MAAWNLTMFKMYTKYGSGSLRKLAAKFLLDYQERNDTAWFSDSHDWEMEFYQALEKEDKAKALSLIEIREKVMNKVKQ